MIKTVTAFATLKCVNNKGAAIYRALKGQLTIRVSDGLPKAKHTGTMTDVKISSTQQLSRHLSYSLAAAATRKSCTTYCSLVLCSHLFSDWWENDPKLNLGCRDVNRYLRMAGKPARCGYCRV